VAPAEPVVVVSLVAAGEALTQALAAYPAAPVVRALEDDLSEVHARWHQARSQHVVVVAPDVATVRLALPVLPSLGTTRQLTLALPEEEARELPGSMGNEVRVMLREPAPLHDLVADLVADSPRRCPSRPASGLRVAAADVAALAWCLGDASARTTANADPSWRGDETRGDPCDVLVQTQAAPHEAPGFTVDVARRCPPVDIGVANPAGFDVEAGTEVGYVVVTDLPGGEQEVRLATSSVDVAQLGHRGRLSASALDQARALQYVDATAIHHAEPALAAHVLTQLGASGVPLLTGRLPRRVVALLHDDVVSALTESTPDTSDPEMREAHSIRVRRAVLRNHSHSGVWRELRASLGFAPAPRPQVSVQLVTKRRQFLDHAVRSVGQQRNVDVELVLVTHGFSLDGPELARLSEQLPFPIVTSTIRDEAYFGDALNHALDRTSGSLVAKMDDDDWYGPHHLEDLVQTMAWSGAALVGALQQYTYLADVDTTVRRRVVSTKQRRPAHVPGGTMLLRREDLLGLGGWRPLRQSGPEDLSLSHAVRESGGRIQEAHGLGFVLCRHGRGHTWNVSSDRFIEGASQQWPGFHAPPELGEGPVTRDHYADVRAAAQSPIN